MKRTAFFLVAYFALPSYGVMAAKTELTPFVGLIEEYNDNVYFTHENEMNDFITTVSPGIKWKWATERYSARALGEMDLRAYHDETELNAVDQKYEGDLEYKITPMLSLTSDGLFRREARPDRDVESTGLVLGTSVRDRMRLGAGTNYIFNENTSLFAKYGFLRDEFDDPEFSDSNTHEIQTGSVHNLNNLLSRTKGFVNLGYRRHNFIGSRSNAYSLTLGAERQLTELFSFFFHVGGRYSDTQTWGIRRSSPNPPYILHVPLSQEISDDRWGGVGSAGLHYDGEKNKWKLSFDHDLRAASGSNGTAKRTHVGFSYMNRITSELRGGLESEYYLNKTESGTIIFSRKIDTETFEIRPKLMYQISPDMALITSYKYTFVDDEEENRSRDRSQFLIRLDYQYPLYD